MAMQFFVNPKNTTRLYPWGEGENAQYWIEVKDHLSAKEERDIQTAGIPHILQKAGGKDTPAQAPAEGREMKMGLDVGRMALIRAAKQIVRWSLTDADGQPMPLSEASIGELLPEQFDAIDKALDAHKEAKAAEKKDQSGSDSRKSA